MSSLKLLVIVWFGSLGECIYLFNFLSYLLHEKYPYSEFFWSIFSRIWIEYGEMRNISPYTVPMRENARKLPIHFSRNDCDGYYSKQTNLKQLREKLF